MNRNYRSDTWIPGPCMKGWIFESDIHNWKRDYVVPGTNAMRLFG